LESLPRSGRGREREREREREGEAKETEKLIYIFIYSSIDYGGVYCTVLYETDCDRELQPIFVFRKQRLAG
jgi:hypothetical protein